MEWVEVRGETLDAAKEEALDQLGVAHDDAEFEVVQEPESKWLGIKKTEARVRARVRPTQPRPKKENRNNRRPLRGGSGDGGNGGGRSKGGGNNRGGNGGNRNKGGDGGTRNKGGDGGNRNRGGNNRGGNDDGKSQRGNNQPSDTDQRAPKNQRGHQNAKKEAAVSDEARQEPMPVEAQQAAAETFLKGLAEGFGMSATVSSRLEDDVIIASLDGDDLGLLIGPKGGTMYAIQELARSSVQRQSEGRDTGRLMIDVSGYRGRRRAALAEFAARQAEKVTADGVEVALEPMNSADRKAIHDAVVEIDGVNSISEGDDPRRRVVLVPED